MKLEIHYANLRESIEEERNKLCYGRPHSEEEIKKVIDAFNKLKAKFLVMGYGNEL